MKKSVIIVLIGLLPMAVQAQKDSTLNRTVVVENEYNPTVMAPPCERFRCGIMNRWEQ